MVIADRGWRGPNALEAELGPPERTGSIVGKRAIAEEHDQAIAALLRLIGVGGEDCTGEAQRRRSLEALALWR